MKDRIRFLRNELHLTQQEFADRLKVSRNNIAGHESGTRSPSDAVISLICSVFHVSETWLQKGTGEMFVQADKNAILERCSECLSDYPHSFKSRFIAAMSKLDEKEWKYIERIAKKIIASPLTYDESIAYGNVADNPDNSEHSDKA